MPQSLLTVDHEIARNNQTNLSYNHLHIQTILFQTLKQPPTRHENFDNCLLNLMPPYHPFSNFFWHIAPFVVNKLPLTSKSNPIKTSPKSKMMPFKPYL